MPDTISVWSREPGAGSREPGARSQEPGARSQEAFGLTPEWLTYEGRVVPSAIVLSHEEQRERLAVSCPEAVGVSVVAGDPCLDQLRASSPFREDYRTALGLQPEQKLIVVSSTWGRGSILASDERESDVLRRVLAELPADDYRVLAAVHPNAWYGHGSWQLQTWLAPLLEQGLLLPVPDTETWKSALLAADGLVGDHGSLTLYGMSLGIPTVLGSFAESKVAPRSPMAELGAVLPRLSAHRPFLPQFEAARAAQRDDARLSALRASVSSRPGESAALLRRLFYRWLELPEPESPARPRPVPVPVPLASGEPRAGSSPVQRPVYAAVSAAGRHAIVRRYPAPVQRRTMEIHLARTHLVADIDDPDARWPRSADVLFIPLGRPSAAAVGWDDVAIRYPGCALLAREEPRGGCLVLLPGNIRLRAHWHGTRPWWASAALAASVVYEHVTSRTVPSGSVPSRPGRPGPARMTVTIGPATQRGLLDITVA